MGSGTARIVCGVFLALLAGSTPPAGAKDAPLRALFPKSWVKAGLIDAPVPIAFTLSDASGKPISGIGVTLVCGGDSLQHATTDREGMFLLTLGRKHLRRRCRLRRDHQEDYPSVEISWDFQGNLLKEGRRYRFPQAIDLRSLHSLERERGGVYYEADVPLSTAEHVLEMVERQDAELSRLLGHALPPVAVAVARRRLSVQPAGTAYESIWPVQLREDGSVDAWDIHGLLPHERVEGYLRDLVPRRDGFDPRWLYDGLSDSCSACVLETMAPEAARRFLLDRARSAAAVHGAEIDLLSWRSVRRLVAKDLDPGDYARALAFWLKVGPPCDEIRSFLESLAALPAPDDNSIIDLLSRARGLSPDLVRSSLRGIPGGEAELTLTTRADEIVATRVDSTRRDATRR